MKEGAYGLDAIGKIIAKKLKKKQYMILISDANDKVMHVTNKKGVKKILRKMIKENEELVDLDDDHVAQVTIHIKGRTLCLDVLDEKSSYNYIRAIVYGNKKKIKKIFKKIGKKYGIKLIK